MTYMAATAPRIESIHKARLIAAMMRVYKRKSQAPSDAGLHTRLKIPSRAPKFPVDGVTGKVSLPCSSFLRYHVCVAQWCTVTTVDGDGGATALTCKPTAATTPRTCTSAM